MAQYSCGHSGERRAIVDIPEGMPEEPYLSSMDEGIREENLGLCPDCARQVAKD